MKRYIAIPILLASFAAHANDGLIRFSGRIAAPPCAMQRSGADIVLERCPLAAQGARIQVMPLDDAAPARLLDSADDKSKASKARHASVSNLSATTLAGNALSFSSRYQLSGANGTQAPTAGRYLVTVDYL